MLLFAQSDAAVQLDWNAVDWTQSWTPGTSGNATVSQTFQNVQGSGIAVTLTLTTGPNTSVNADGLATGGSNNIPLPDDLSGAPLTNGTSGQQALMVDANFSNINNDYITFTISFSKPVQGVNFNIWDIDYGNRSSNGTTSYYRDVISTFSANGAAPTGLTLTAVGSDVQANNTTDVLRGIATNGSTSNWGNENDTTNKGNGKVDFGSQQVTSVSFRYSSDYAGPSGTNSTLQRIALDDINFTLVTAVPEPSAALLGGLGLLGLLRRRRY
jgi:hypothetical protein